MANEDAARAHTEAEQAPGADQSAAQQAVHEAEMLDAPSIPALEQEIAQLMARVNEQQESVLRAQAEMQNVRRRAERDVENAHKFALDKFSADLLPVVDSLERALDAAGQIDNEAVKGMKDGIELTLKMFTDTLAKHGVQQVNPLGQPFNPEFHQAMSMVPNPDLAPNSVMAVLQKGYTLSGRLVRPAMVVVSKAAS
ncbi:MAG TPA: nucleotide exchange factor GrpE [Candidatus Kapabacteria bacterium]|nr:nucleotide exchange factor GrpE [Candidatus Kapabacteria bacterium]